MYQKDFDIAEGMEAADYNTGSLKLRHHQSISFVIKRHQEKRGKPVNDVINEAIFQINGDFMNAYSHICIRKGHIFPEYMFAQ